VQTLVVIIPGIGGSVLRPTGQQRGGWSAGPVPLARTLVWPDRLDLERCPDLTPVDLVKGVTTIRGITVLPGYADLVNDLETLSGGKSAVLRRGVVDIGAADVVRFPYDFRKGVAAAAQELARLLHPILQGRSADPARPVVIVGHSMGGLVGRYWLACCEGWRRCATLITLGTPHRGAPLALDWLVNRVRLRGVPVPRAARVLRAWPGVWDLTPQYAAVWDDSGGRSIRPTELPAQCVAAGGDGVAEAVLAGLRAGARTHTAIAAGWGQIPVGQVPEVYAVLARRHGTPARAVLSGGRLSVSKCDADWLPDSEGWSGGDGTVPAYSAVPVETAQRPLLRRAVWQRHGPMGSSAVVAEIVEEFRVGSTRGIRGFEEPGVAVDIDNIVAAGQPVPITATLIGTQADRVTTLAVRLRPVPPVPDGRRPWGRPIPLTPQDGQWSTTLAPLPAGSYEVEVTADAVPGAAPAVMTDVIDVVDPGEPDPEDTDPLDRPESLDVGAVDRSTA
jgi:hypothetical protein